MAEQNLLARLLSQFNVYYQKSILVQLEKSPFLARALGYHHGWNDAEGGPLNAHPGKQIRPLLTLLSCGAMGSPPDNAHSMAAAIELIHNFSLIHDDVMDVSDTRRGRTTVWRIWGENQAINVGDGAYGLSFLLLAEAEKDLPDVDPRIIVHGERMLARACVDTVTGQIMDISFEERDEVSSDEYTTMVGLKTGPLLGAALGGGAMFGGATIEQADKLETIGRRLGVAFQIQDDILGIWGDPDETGKANTDDLTHKKKSLPVLWALENLSGAAESALRELYAAEAPLPEASARRIQEILTRENVREAVGAVAQSHYEAVIEGLQEVYPDSEYRDELLNIAALIVNRSR